MFSGAFCRKRMERERERERKGSVCSEMLMVVKVQGQTPEKQSEHAEKLLKEVARFADWESSTQDEDVVFLIGDVQVEALNSCVAKIKFLAADAGIPLESVSVVDQTTIDPRFRRGLCLSWTLPPTETIRRALDTEAAFYFDFMKHLCTWLGPVTLLGVFFFVRSVLYGVTVDEDSYMPIFGLIIILWAALVVRFWERREAGLKLEWAQQTRHGGMSDLDFVEGDAQIFKRALKHFAAFCVAVPYLFLAFAFIVVSMNFQGYVGVTSRGLAAPSELVWTEALIFIPQVARFAAPGGLFDAEGLFSSLVPVAVHVAVVALLNEGFQLLMRWAFSGDDAELVIAYRFAFESFDAYLPPLYLAFVQFNVHKLRRELLSVYAVDVVRRLFLESGVPLAQRALRQWGGWGRRRSRVLYKTGSGEGTRIRSGSAVAEEIARGFGTESAGGVGSSSSSLLLGGGDGAERMGKLVALLDGMEGDAESFDDLMEVSIEFGYCVLFAAALPLGPLLFLIASIVESRSDLFKYLTLYRPPARTGRVGIGVWTSVLQALVILGAASNAFIVGLSSEQLASWMPHLFLFAPGREGSEADLTTFRMNIGSFPSRRTLRFDEVEGEPDAVLRLGMGRYVVGLSVLLEHTLVLLVLLVFWTVPSAPVEVRRERQKRFQRQVERTLRDHSESFRPQGSPKGETQSLRGKEE